MASVLQPAPDRVFASVVSGGPSDPAGAIPFGLSPGDASLKSPAGDPGSQISIDAAFCGWPQECGECHDAALARLAERVVKVHQTFVGGGALERPVVANVASRAAPCNRSLPSLSSMIRPQWPSPRRAASFGGPSCARSWGIAAFLKGLPAPYQKHSSEWTGRSIPGRVLTTSLRASSATESFFHRRYPAPAVLRTVCRSLRARPSLARRPVESWPGN